MVSLGLLDLHGPIATLEKTLDVQRLQRFEVDMVVVRRAGQDGPGEFVIGGLVELFYKWNMVASLTGAWPEEDHSLAGVVLAAEDSRGLKSQASVPLGQLVDQGRTLFVDETFDGNGRTCGTCHRGNNNFTLDPTLIATLPNNYPLLVNETNSDLTQMDNATLMRGVRGLIQENIDGFANPPVFRGPPPLNNLNFTGPYGLSGDFATIPQFTTGAVMQHFPKTLNRAVDVDFRLPTQSELDAMEAFQLSIFLPSDEDFNLDSFVDTAAEQSGRDLFFGAAKCSQCHGGTVLSDASVGLAGNQSFNTGVVNLAINSGSNEGFGPLPQEANGNRQFSTPQLFGVKDTGPFFHDNSMFTLRNAVAFYNTAWFNTSPDGTAVRVISLSDQNIDDILAFLEALVEPQVAPTSTSVPGVTHWGLVVMAALLVSLLAWQLRKRRRRAS